MFLSLHQDDAIELWQTLHIDPETTLHEVLTKFIKFFSSRRLRKVSRYKWDQFKHEKTQKIHKHIGKQAFVQNAIEYVSEFLFGKLPVQSQQELTTAGKRYASTDEIKDFVQRRFQYQNLILNHQLRPFSQMYSGTDKPNKREQRAPQAEDRRVPEFQGTGFHCK